MNKKYPSIGSAYTDTDQKKDRLQKTINEIEWHTDPKDKLPMMQALGLKGLIKQKGNNVSRYGYAVHQDGLCLLAMENNYKSGEVRKAIVYVIDDGVSLTPVLVDENPE